MTHMTYGIKQALGFLYHQSLIFETLLENDYLQHMRPVMESVLMLQPSLVGALLWLLLLESFSLLFPVISNVQGNSVERETLGLERGVVDINDNADVKLSEVNSAVSVLPQCVKLSETEPLALHSGGDVVIGGLFPLHYVASQPSHSYQSKPQLAPCSG